MSVRPEHPPVSSRHGAASHDAGESGAPVPYHLSTYFRLRLCHVLDAGKTLLMQRWLALFLILFLSPALPIVALVLRAAHFTVAMLQSPGSFGRHFGAIAAAQLSFLLWSEGLRPILRGGAFRSVLDSLPIAFTARLVVAAGLLALLDMPLLLPLPVGLMLIGVQVPQVALLYIMKALVFAVLTILVQAARIEAAPVLALCVIVANLALAWACCETGPVSALSALGPFALVLSALIGGAGLLLAARFEGRSGPLRPCRRSLSWRSGWWERLEPALRLQLGCCLEAGNVTRGIAILVWSLPVALWALLRVFGYDSRSVPVEIVALGLMAQLSLTPYASLAESHRRASGFCLALPMTRSFWVRRDIGLVLGLFAMPTLLCLLPLALHRLMSSGVLLAVSVSYLALLTALRFTIPIDPRWRPMPAIMLSMLWIAAILTGVPA